jgi:HlyD family secretion protein
MDDPNPAAESATSKSDDVRRTLQSSRTRGRLRWILTAVVLIAAAATAAWWFFSDDDEGTSYHTATADRGDIVLSATATGSLEPKRKVTVGAEISGLIEEVMVEQNDRVTQGQPLARIDTTRLENSLAQAEANLAQARAGLQQAKASLEEAELEEERAKALFEKGSTSKQTLQQARAARKRAEAQVESSRASIAQARASVKLQRTDLRKATIYSPVDGVVLARKVEPGNTVAASLQTPELFVLAEDLSDMELHVGIDEADISLVEAGQSGTFTVDAWPDQTFEATVELVALNPTVTNNVVTYTAELDVDNTERRLRPGMTATVTIQTGRRDDVLRVPNTALRFLPPEPDQQGGFRLGPPRDDERQPDSDTVYRLVDGKPQKVHVETGRSDGKHTEIRGGDLKADDTVVTGIRSKGEGTS